MQIILALVVSFLTVPAIAAWSKRNRLLDEPNHRSSHAEPTPRMGGLGVAAGMVVALLASGTTVFRIWPLLLLAASMGAVGFLDDFLKLSARFRLFCQVAAGIFVVLWAWPALHEWSFSFFLGPVVIVWVISGINAFNFMDGVNGIAAGQAIVTLYGAALILGDGDLNELSLIAVAAVTGFLPWNVPRAFTFLGDGGSYLLGFLCALCALVAALAGGHLLIAPLLFLPFLVDTGATLMIRARKGERLTEAHRTHFYQRLNRCGWSHVQVAALYTLLAAFSAGAAWALARDGWSPRTIAAVSAAAAVQMVVPFLVFFRERARQEV